MEIDFEEVEPNGLLPFDLPGLVEKYGSYLEAAELIGAS
jgi:hypothetical protein